jgi:hypothetical protein
MVQEHGQDAPDQASLDRENLSTADLARSGERRDTGSMARQETARGDEKADSLFPQQETQELRDRWHTIQAAFVDEPRKAVEDADGLVAATMKRLAEIFAKERENLESQWDRGDEVSTEDLRVALRRYRSFFDRLLSM